MLSWILGSYSSDDVKFYMDNLSKFLLKWWTKGNINQFPRNRTNFDLKLSIKLHNWNYTNQQVGKLVPSMLHLTHASSQLGQSIFHFSWLVWSYIASSFFFGTRPEKTSTFLYQVQTFLRLVISYKMDTWGGSTTAHSVHVWIWIKS